MNSTIKNQNILKIITMDYVDLVDINIDLIEWALRAIGVSTCFKRSSKLEEVYGSSTERLISICKSVDGDEYLSGAGGNNYQDEEMFKKTNIKLTMMNFEHPIYNQLWGEFIPNLSIIDLIFNCGKNSRQIITGK